MIIKSSVAVESRLKSYIVDDLLIRTLWGEIPFEGSTEERQVLWDAVLECLEQLPKSATIYVTSYPK